MVFNNLPVAFPWYDKIEKQNIRKPHSNVCDYKLNTPSDALLPFEFRRDKNTFPPAKWEILNVNTDIVVADITPSLSLLRVKTRSTYDYFYYAGEALTATYGPLQSDKGGFYYSRITMSNGRQVYSEVFFVPTLEFTVSGSPSTGFIKFEWYNDSDLKPLFYNDKDVNGIPYFKNVVYLDSFIHQSEPEITEETTKDGIDNEIPVFQRAIIRYSVSDIVPDFLKQALVLTQMHDHVFLTTPGNVYSGEIENIVTASTPEANGYYSVVDITFEEEIAIIKKSCIDNLPTPSIAVITPTLSSVITSGSNVLVNAVIQSGFWGVLYSSDIPSGTYTVASGPLQYADLLAGTASVPISNFGSNLYFKIKAQNFNSISGFSNQVTKT